jgi:two-component system OmpR family sensor kinase
VSRPGAAWLSRWLSPALAPLLAGVIIGVVLELAEPDVRVYVSVSPGVLAAAVGLFATLTVLAVTRLRWLAADAAAAAALRNEAARSAADRHRFLTRLDHELKNPLTAIRAGLANLDQAGRTAQPGDASEAAATAATTALASVSAQADRITRLLSDLRKLAELETLSIEATPVDIPALLHEVAEAAGELPGAGERVIRVTTPAAPWPLPFVSGDRDLLFVAVHNLVTNAVKFSAPSDTVEIRASEDGDAVLIEVADTGAGIPADEIEEVWQELARGRAARSLPGTGIGLALVRVIAARHGGRVAIRSREGAGTEVSMWLPASERTGAASAVPILRQRRDIPGTAAL